MELLDLSNILGLTALGAIVVNLVLGLSIWSRFRVPLPKGLSLLKLHKMTGYLAFCLAVFHVALIPFIHSSGYRWRDLLLPLWTSHQPRIHSLGAAAFYLLAVIIISSYYKPRIPYKVWRRLHYFSYAALPLLLIHGLFTDPSLKDKPIDFLDAEKVFVEACAFIFLALFLYRSFSAKSRQGSDKKVPRSIVPLLAGIAALGVSAYGEVAEKECCRLDPDMGVIIGPGPARFITWGYGQWALGNGVDPYFRRVRQGSEMDFPSMGGVQPVAVYEVDLTDNDFFRAKPAWKIWENAFIAFQNAQDPSRLRVLYGENTHILSFEDNLPSGNLPTVNRSAILESHGSLHAFGTQWGGQVQARINPRLQLAFSAGDNRGSLNQDEPRFSPINDWAAKANWTLWQSESKGSLLMGAALAWTHRIDPGSFVLASALANAPVLSIAAEGSKTTLETDGALQLNGSFPSRISWEWISSFFSRSDTRAQGGYLQILSQFYEDKRYGDLSVFLRPEWAILNGVATPHAEATILRTGINWNVPLTAQRVNILAENAWHITSGDPSLVLEKDPGYEFRLMLRASLTRHNRF